MNRSISEANIFVLPATTVLTHVLRSIIPILPGDVCVFFF